MRVRGVGRRSRYWIALVAIGAVWLAATITAPRPVNPPVDPAARIEATTDVPAAVHDVLRAACFDCHSDETAWPWYARWFPASWLVGRDVEEGRGQMNFSRWTTYNAFDRADMLDEACDHARRRAMPLWPYRLLHADARLGDEQIETLCAWMSTEAARLAGEARR